MSVNFTPTPVVAGIAPTAAQLNASGAGAWTDIQAAWDTYTPTWGGGSTLGNGTLTGGYKRVGKDIHFWAQIVVGSTTSVGGASQTLTLPVAAKSGLNPVFTGEAYDTSAGGSVQLWTSATSATVAILLVPGTTAGGYGRPVTGSVPFAWATGDRIWISGTYEAA